MPANKICDPISPAAISNMLYPILIHGKALPHSAQQITAITATTPVLHKNCGCLHFLLSFNVIIYIPLSLSIHTVSPQKAHLPVPTDSIQIIYDIFHFYKRFCQTSHNTAMTSASSQLDAPALSLIYLTPQRYL